MVLGVEPVNRDLTLLLDPVGGDSVSPSCSSAAPPRPRGLVLAPVNSTLGLTRRLPAVPVVSEGGADWLTGDRLMIPWMDTGSTEGTVIDSGRPEKPPEKEEVIKEVGLKSKPEKEGTLGPVGRRELGKVVCSTGNLSQQQKSTTEVNNRS